MTNLISHLGEQDEEIFELDSVQIIIEFKWITFTRIFFTFQLLLYSIFIVLFIFDVVAISWNEHEFERTSLYQVIPRCFCMFIISLFFFYDCYDFIKNKGDFNRFWNYNDILLFILFTIFFTMSLTSPHYVYALKCLQLAIVLSGFIKLTYLIRILTKLSFLVRMLLMVFLELRYFLIFFILVIGAMSVMIQIILFDSGESYEGIKTIAFFVLALR